MLTLVVIMCGHLGITECREEHFAVAPHITTLEQCQRQAFVILPQVMAQYPGMVANKWYCTDHSEREA